MLEDEINHTKELYRDIFLKSKNALISKLNTISGTQEKLDFLNNEVSKSLLERIGKMREDLADYECKMCGSCCKMASSEFNFEQLKEKASKGDKFAGSFTEVFVPYEDKSKAMAHFPEYAKLLEKAGLIGQTNFYYCPKLNADNTCSNYSNRPHVCRDFPNNPLVILPPGCGFNAWKEAHYVEALFLNAMIELVGFFIEELNGQ